VLQYFISTHGARKAWRIRHQDRRLRLPDPRLVDVAQDVIISENIAARSTASTWGPS